MINLTQALNYNIWADLFLNRPALLVSSGIHQLCVLTRQQQLDAFNIMIRKNPFFPVIMHIYYDLQSIKNMDLPVIRKLSSNWLEEALSISNVSVKDISMMYGNYIVQYIEPELMTDDINDYGESGWTRMSISVLDEDEIYEKAANDRGFIEFSLEYMSYVYNLLDIFYDVQEYNSTEYNDDIIRVYENAKKYIIAKYTDMILPFAKTNQARKIVEKVFNEEDNEYEYEY